MPFFPTRILVGADGTPASHHALMAAAELAQATGSELHIVHAKLRRPLLRGQPMTPAQRARTDAEAAELLEAERAAAAEAGTEADTHLRYGDRVEEVFAQAQVELQADLLVVGESRTGRLGRSLLGAAGLSGGSPQTVRRSTASVLVVRPPVRDDLTTKEQ